MIRFTGILFIAFVLFFIGCGKPTTINGKEFIERDVLVDVLADLHLVDAVTNDRKFHHLYEVDSVDLLSPILEKYKVNRAMFDTTLAVYKNHPDLLDQVYNDVLIKLNVLLDENDTEGTTRIPID